jgi:hypothetical protein
MTKCLAGATCIGESLTVERIASSEESGNIINEQKLRQQRSSRGSPEVARDHAASAQVKSVGEKPQKKGRK